MQGWKRLTVKLTGTAPLLVHRGGLASPLDKFSRAIKAISSKRKKTDADFAEMARLEWYGSLYLEDGKPVIPAEMVEAAICEGAKVNKLGKTMRGAIQCLKNAVLENGQDDLSDLDALWANEAYRDSRICRIGLSRIVRTRPRFDKWSIVVEVDYDDEKVSKDQILEALHHSSFGDFRPRFGRATPEVVE